MTKLEEVKETLYQTNASLVVYDTKGEKKVYFQDRIKDIKQILQKDELAFKEAIVADKVIGKVAASILTVAGIKQLYADTISKLAIPILEQNKIAYEYRQKVEYIINKDHTGMCPMENKYQEEKDIHKIYNEMIK